MELAADKTARNSREEVSASARIEIGAIFPSARYVITGIAHMLNDSGSGASLGFRPLQKRVVSLGGYRVKLIWDWLCWYTCARKPSL